MALLQNRFMETIVIGQTVVVTKCVGFLFIFLKEIIGHEFCKIICKADLSDLQFFVCGCSSSSCRALLFLHVVIFVSRVGIVVAVLVMVGFGECWLVYVGVALMSLF